MAEYSFVKENSQEDPGSVSWADYARSVGVGVEDVNSMLSAAGRFIAEKAGDEGFERYNKAGQDISDIDRQSTISNMTPAGRQRLEATVTSDEFWAHPFSAVALKSARMTPQVAASIAPALLLPGGPIAGTIGAGLVGGTMTTAQTLDDLYGQIDKLSDDELTEKVPFYRGLRATGVSEEDARRKFGAEIRGNKVLWNFLLGAVTNAIGPGGQAVRALKGGTAALGAEGRGLAGRVAIGAGEGFATEGVEEGGQNLSVQSAAVEGNLQEKIDWRQVIDNALEGGMLGSVFAAPMSISHGGHGAPTGKPTPGGPAAPVAKLEGGPSAPTSGIEVLAPGQPAAAVKAALEAQNPPPVPTAAPEVAAPAQQPTAPISPQPEAAPATISPQPDPSIAQAPAPIAQPATPVTTEGNPAVNPEVTAPTAGTAASENQVAGAPRVLPDLSPESQANAQAQTEQAQGLQKEAKKQTTKEKRVAKLEQPISDEEKDLGFRARLKKNIGKAGEAKRIDDARAAKAIFEASPQAFDMPSNPAERNKLQQQLQSISDAADKAGITVPAKKVGYETSSDYVIWLKEAKDLASKLKQKTSGKGVRDQIAAFTGRHAAAKGGDFEIMRAERKVEGDQAKRVTQGDVSTKAAANLAVGLTGKTEAATGDEEIEARSGDDNIATNEAALVRSGSSFDKNSVTTLATRSAAARPRLDAGTEEGTIEFKDGKTRAKAASEGRSTKEQATDAEKARLIAELDKLNKKEATLKKHKELGLNAEANQIEDTRVSAMSELTGEQDKAPAKTEPEAPAGAGPKTAEVLAKVKKPKKPTKKEQQADETAAAYQAVKMIQVDKASGFAPKKVEPTDAQKEAGNYPKEKRNVGGLPVSVETKKGELRTGTGPDGKKWSVEMPGDYGYIRRTEGADGEQVDVTLGPLAHPDYNGPVTIIDQVDPDTRKFDEHKVFIGYAGREKALAAYDASFSDGRGAERVGNLRTLPMAEFKEWLKEPQTKPAAETIPNSPLNDMAREEYQYLRKKLLQFHQQTKARFGSKKEANAAFSSPDHADIQPKLEAIRKRILELEAPPANAPAKVFTLEDFNKFVESNNLQDILNDIPSSIFEKKMKPLDPVEQLKAEKGKFDRERYKSALDKAGISDAAPHTPDRAARLLASSGEIYRSDTRQVAKPHQTYSLKEALSTIETSAHPFFPFLAQHIANVIPDMKVHVVEASELDRLAGRAVNGFYDPGPNHIVMRDELLLDPHEFARVLLHEGIHGLTTRKINMDPKVRTTIRKLMDALAKRQPYLKEHYGFADEHEFLAEAMTKPTFQKYMKQVMLTPTEARELGIAEWRKVSTWRAFIQTVQKFLRWPGKQGYSALEAAISLTERTSFAVDPVGEAQYANNVATERRTTAQKMAAASEARRVRYNEVPAQKIQNSIRETVKGFSDDAVDRVRSIVTGSDLQAQEGKPWLLGLLTDDMIAQRGENVFAGNVIRKIADIGEMIRTRAEKILKGSEPIVNKFYTLQKKYGADGHWQRFTELVNDEQQAGVFADRALDHASQAHLGKEALNGYWPKSRWAELHERWKALPDDLKAARKEAMEYFTAQQNEMTLGLTRNALAALGFTDEAMVKRVHEKKTTDADRDALGVDLLRQVMDAGELSKINGPYMPQMRRGDHVVTAYYKVTDPTNATRKLADNEFEFDTRKKAIDYATSQDLRPTITSVWVNEKTGETHVTDDEGETVKVHSADVGSVRRFRVRLQNQHTEFVDGSRAARRLAKQFEDDPVFDKVKGAQERRFEANDRGTELMSSQMKTLAGAVEKGKGWRDLSPSQRVELVRALREASLRFQGSTRIQSRRLPRRYVEGASRDLTRNTMDYAKSTAGYLSKLHHQPELEAALKSMHEQANGDYAKGGSLSRSAIANEIEKRQLADRIFEKTGTMEQVVKRIKTASFADKLIGPSQNIINMMQVAMVTSPTLAGRHGWSGTTRALTQAYRDIGTLGILKQGFKDIAAKAKNAQAESTDFIADLTSKVKDAKERELIKYLADRGSLDAGSGMEVGPLIERRDGALGKLDGVLGYVEGIGRQLPQAIETINRATTALAAYRLERAKGSPHENSMRYAQETVNNTQGLYSATNAPPIFNHPLASLALQFKKYGQMMYHLIGSNIGRAYRNASPGERAQAIKTLGYLAISHAAIAGLLGLPTEPFKFLLLGAKAAGLTSHNWDDVERAVRDGLAAVVGKGAGEILAKGLPHLIGVDLSSRVGLDSLMTFGEPKKSDEDSTLAWIFKTVIGAPGALVVDWAKGANALTSGDFTKAAELLIPLKAAADLIRAYRQSTEGKKNQTGREVSAPYSVGEAITRSLGFTPARESEEGARRASVGADQQRYQQERRDLASSWINAKGADRAKAYAKITAWNQDKPTNAKLTMSDLHSQEQRRETEGRNGTYQGGVRIDKRTKHLVNEADQTFNVQKFGEFPVKDPADVLADERAATKQDYSKFGPNLPEMEAPTEDRRREGDEEHDALFHGTTIHRERFLKKYGFDAAYEAIVEQANADAKRKPGTAAMVDQATVNWINNYVEMIKRKDPAAPPRQPPRTDQEIRQTSEFWARVNSPRNPNPDQMSKGLGYDDLSNAMERNPKEPYPRTPYTDPTASAPPLGMPPDMTPPSVPLPRSRPKNLGQVTTGSNPADTKTDYKKDKLRTKLEEIEDNMSDMVDVMSQLAAQMAAPTKVVRDPKTGKVLGLQRELENQQ